MPKYVPAFLLLLASAPAASAAGPYDDLLKYVPPPTNTLVLVNVNAAYASPLAQSEKWADNFYQRYKSGIGFVPPDGSAVVIASLVNLSNVTRDYQIGLVRVTGFPTTKSLAAREGGTTDLIAGQGVAFSPRNIYLTTLNGPTVAAVYPADRQATARWLRHAMASKTANLAPYLKGAVAAAG